MTENLQNFTKTNTKTANIPTDSRRWENLKEETPKKIYTKTYCSHGSENWRERKHIERSKREIKWYLYEKLYSNYNEFLIRNQRLEQSSTFFNYLNKCQHRIQCPLNIFFRSERKIKLFSKTGKLREFTIRKPK